MQSIRRELLDHYLKNQNDLFSGVVVDIGGEATNYRGTFQPPRHQVLEWSIVNIDPSSGADIIAPADNIPLPDQYADVVLMTEVLEHLQNPEAALAETERLLKPGGIMIATMPFMYQVHGDPHDYTRWTAYALKLKIEQTGMNVIALNSMGGTWSVIYDILRSQLYRNAENSRFRFRFYHGILKLMRPLFRLLDRGCVNSHRHITTGWAVQAKK